MILGCQNYNNPPYMQLEITVSEATYNKTLWNLHKLYSTWGGVITIKDKYKVYLQDAQTPQADEVFLSDDCNIVPLQVSESTKHTVRTTDYKELGRSYYKQYT